MADLFDDTLAYDMVRQAGERLGTYDVFRTAVDQLHHFAGQKPSFTGLVSDRYDRLGVFCQLLNVCRRIKMLALFKRGACGGAQPFERLDAEQRIARGLFAHAKLVCLELVVVQAVEQEVEKIRYDRLCALGFEQLREVVVRLGVELDEDLSDDADARLFHVPAGQFIEFFDDLAAHPVELAV